MQAESPENSNSRKARTLQELNTKILSSTAPLIGGGQIAALHQELQQLPPQAPPQRAFLLRERLAEELLFAGDLEQAAQEIDRLERIAVGRQLGSEYMIRAWMKHVTLCLRQGEQANCFTHHNEESCIFPLSPKAVHQDKSGALGAIEVLEKILEVKPDHLTAVWLLNLAHMTAGTYPDGVPSTYRIPPERFESEYDIGRFVNVAASVGLANFNLAGGAIMDDFDGDGRLDVMTSSSKGDQPLSLMHNNGDGTFVETATEAGLAGQIGGLNLVSADYDNDGRLDVLVLRGAWMGEWGEIPNSLLHQLPDGTFEDVTLGAGIEVAAPTQTAAWADVDLDGWLDLYIGYETRAAPSGRVYPSKLYKNLGDGRFIDVSKRAGVENWAYAKGVAFGDYDNDGDPDLYVSNIDLPNHLYRNDGDWSFTEVAAQMGVQNPIHSFGTWFFDYDNDGYLDLWVNHYGQDRTDSVIAYYWNGTAGFDCGRLYRNDGKGGFRDVTRELHLDRAIFPMGCSFGDLDNDGFQDVYLGTGDPSLSSLWPNIMLRNDAGKHFQDVTKSGGFGVLQKGHGVAFGDIDSDGDQDVFIELGGATPQDGFWNALFLNPGHPGHWICLRLEGVRTNRSAIGARVRVRILEGGQERMVCSVVGYGSSFGGNSLQQELGLGDAERILSLEIEWPVSRELQRFENVPMDCFLSIREGDASFEKLSISKVQLGS